MGLLSWELLLGLAHVGLALVVSGHAVLTKSDVRSAIGWIGLVWLTPILGSVLYFFLGINRIRRAAGRMRIERGVHTADLVAARPAESIALAEIPPSLVQLAALTNSVSSDPLTRGNAIDPLIDGDQAYPAMLDAIHSARNSVALATYIFDHGKVAKRFVAALAAARERGVQVRVLIDGVGARYSRPSIVRELRTRDIPVALFLPSVVPFAHPYFNLRNHRKLMIVDGTIGFTGGMNIRDRCVLADNPRHPTRDVHFRLRGPVVGQLLEAFVFDWRFTTGEVLRGPIWFPPLELVGEIVARAIPDGPDETRDAFLLTLLGALAEAQRRVTVVTPYFLPDTGLVEALRVTALRGVEVRILVPRIGNLRLVQWAQQAVISRVLARGCRVELTRAPFDHTKLMVVDGLWSLIGSANWDPRSTHLNFECVVETYSEEFAALIEEIITEKTADALSVTRDDARRQPLLHRLRDGAAWLLQPYL